MATQAASPLLIGVFHHALYVDEFLPVLERMLKPSQTLEGMKSLRALATSIEDSVRREDATGAIERMSGQAANGKVAKGPIGIVLELLCMEESARLDDAMEEFLSTAPLLYAWNAQHAETLMRFFSSLCDATLPWASTQEVWRAVVAPEALHDAARAASELTPRELRKLLEQADGGDVFSPEQAAEIANWWDQFRTTLRLAWRQERGFYLCTGSTAAQRAALAHEDEEEDDGVSEDPLDDELQAEEARNEEEEDDDDEDDDA